MSILDKEARLGNFTSSQIYLLLTLAKDGVSWGKPALDYIRSKILERRIGRPINVERTGRPALWGHYLQQRVHDLIDDTGYELIEDKTIIHPTISFWCGTPDNKNVRESVVGDIKCYEPKNFCDYSDVLIEAQPNNDTELFKKKFPQEYWQLVSGSILLKTKYIEAILYIPYYDELQEIRESVDMLEGEDEQRKYSFIKHSHYNELAYIKRGGYYKNLSIYRFEVPQADKDLLTAKVIEAGKLLV